MRATNLTDEQIAELREKARREAGPFTNPAIVSSPIHTIPNGPPKSSGGAAIRGV